MKTSDEQQFNPEQSLKVIDEMISTAKGNYVHSGFFFLLWGWLVSIAALAHYALAKFTSFDKPYYAWFLLFIGVFLSIWKGIQLNKTEKTYTHVDRIQTYTWIGFLISYIITLVFMKQLNYQLPPLVFILAGYATFLSGITIKFKPLVWGGFLMWIGSVVMFLISPENQLLLSPILLFVGYLIPGYILRKKAKENA